MQTTFSDLTIKALPQGTHWDQRTRGLGLRVGKQTRTWIVLIRSGRRATLGQYPHLSLKAAREECIRRKAEATLGRIDPKRVAFDTALVEYLTECATHLRPRSLKNYKDYLTSHFRYGKRSLSDITTREIILSLKSLSPSQKEHAHRIGRTFFRWCVRQHLLDRSPMEGLSVPLGKPRSRVLTEDELRAVYRTARAGTSPFHAIVSLLLLTGQRRGEISRLEWDWIGEETITLPAGVTKNGRTHTFPYGEGTASVLASIPRLSDRYVLPAARTRSEHTTVFNGFSKAKADFDLESGVTDWRLHDLRRSYSSFHAKLGTPQIVVEKLLNHISGGTLSPIAAVYNVHRYEAGMREAVLRFERWLATL